jgi:peptidyl-prolyl cis-trans isomerase SurA
LLSNAQVGEMLPPNVMSQGIELLAVCDRKLVKADDKRRAEAAAELRQKEFEIQAKRLLRDLQQDAIIENVGQ